MNDNDKRIKASYQLFDGLICCLADLNGEFENSYSACTYEMGFLELFGSTLYHAD
jgi:hypothetical protein